MNPWIMSALLFAGLSGDPSSARVDPPHSLTVLHSASAVEWLRTREDHGNGRAGAQLAQAVAGAADDHDAGWFVLGGAAVGAVLLYPVARREDSRRSSSDCMGPICALPAIGIVLGGAALGAVAGLVVHRIVHR